MASGIWKEYGLKNTPSRQAVLEVLAAAQGPISAEEVYRRILSGGDGHPPAVSLSTVYRTLATLTQKGLLLWSTGQDGALC